MSQSESEKPGNVFSDIAERLAADSRKKREEAAGSAPLCPYCTSGHLAVMADGSFFATCGGDTCESAYTDRKRRNVMRAGGVPPRYLSAGLSDFVKPVQEAVHSGFNRRDPSLFLTGPAGTGKTHLAAAILTAIPDLVECRWTTAPELLLKIRGTFGNREGANTEESIVREFSESRVLVLDDLGAEKVSDWSLSSLYIVVNRRVDYMLPTICTSNLDLADLDAIDPRLASRLGGFARIKLDGKDRRLTNRPPRGR